MNEKILKEKIDFVQIRHPETENQSFLWAGFIHSKKIQLWKKLTSTTLLSQEAAKKTLLLINNNDSTDI